MSDVQQKVAVLPNEPGVYQFFSEEGTIIYVGKAKDLKKRVSSYFTSRADENRKLQIMVRKIVDIKHIVTPTESDALLLENNLIKKLQPRYNVMLKDDKSYPWICIKNERFPRIFSTRRRIVDGSKYFGPYTSLMTVRVLLELVRQIYPLRTCKLSLSPESIAKCKHRVCLDYHIGNCKGPCEGFQDETTYNDAVEQASNIIKGNVGEVIKMLKNQMKANVDSLNFEEAQIIKNKLERLENYQAKSIIVNPEIDNVDVFSLIIDGNLAYTNFMRVVKGAVVQSQTIEIRMGIEEEPAELLSLVIMEINERVKGLSREIIVPFVPDQELAGKTYTIPKRYDKLKLLQLSERNARAYSMERLNQLKKIDPDKHIERIMSAMQIDLRLPRQPRLMECFDNSNIQGTNPVAACVVFRDGKPAKKEYKHFNVKTVEGPDDFASMEEIIYRRYRRVLDEGHELPGLIVIDGGKGQLAAAVESLKKLDLFGKIPILGLAKRLEEIYFPNDSTPLLLSKNSETLRILMHIRDEAHRFGITFHRNKRSADFIRSQLQSIEGVGEKTTVKLMTTFKTVSRIKSATFEELAEAAGKHAAKLVRKYFDSKEDTTNMMNKIIIAIDGYSSTGKSTIAKAIARRLGYVYVDTGAMYRAVTFYCMKTGIIDKTGAIDTQSVIAALPNICIELIATDSGTETRLNGESVEREIRTIEVAANVSKISAIPEVREAMVAQQQAMGRNKGVVMDGRDIGTVVFPDAELKVFMTAAPEVRAMRRYMELEAKGEKVDLAAVRRNIEERDYADTHRAVAPLKQATDAIVLDNSNMTPDEQLDWIEQKVRKKLNN